MSRTSLMQTWLVSVLGHTDFTVAPASSDASFRSYHRVSLPQGNSFIVMDAPPPPAVTAPAQAGAAGVPAVAGAASAAVAEVVGWTASAL